MSDNVVPFPGRVPAPIIGVSVESSDNVVLSVKCDDPIHYFMERGAPCECGENWWPKDQAVPGC